ncbi:hypothetical protein Tco_1377881 [Tanacetum coccineum]
MAPEHISPGLGHQLMTPGTISSGLVPQPPSPTPNVPPTKNDWDSVFCPMFDEYFNPSPSVAQPVLVAVVQEPVVSTGTPSSTRIDQDTPSTSTSQITQEEQSHVIPIKPSSEESSSRIVIPTNVHSVNQPQEHIEKWTRIIRLTRLLVVILQTVVGMQSMSPETMKKLVDETEELWCLLDHKIQQLSKGSSEGSGTTPEVPDEPKDNSDSINGDVSIHQADLCVQRITSLTLLISMVTEKDSINTTPPTHMLMFNAQLLLDKTFHEELLRGVLERVVGARTNSDGQKDVLVAYDLIHT